MVRIFGGTRDAAIRPCSSISRDTRRRVQRGRGGDCSDRLDSIHPGAKELLGNGWDDDCDGEVDEVEGDDDTSPSGDDDDGSASDDDSSPEETAPPGCSGCDGVPSAPGGMGVLLLLWRRAGRRTRDTNLGGK